MAADCAMYIYRLHTLIRYLGFYLATSFGFSFIVLFRFSSFFLSIDKRHTHIRGAVKSVTMKARSANVICEYYVDLLCYCYHLC